MHTIESASNAVKFSPAEGTVRVELCEKDQRGVFAITDNGAGVNKERISEVFDSFSTRRDHGEVVGCGVSMALSRAIMRAHGGDIDLVSEPGKETTYSGWLPVHSTAAVPS